MTARNGSCWKTITTRSLPAPPRNSLTKVHRVSRGLGLTIYLTLPETDASKIRRNPLRQTVVTIPRPVTRRILRRRCPRRILEIEKVAHVAGAAPAITSIQRLEAKAFFDQLEPSGGIGLDVRNITRFGERRDHHHRHSKAVAGEISRRIVGRRAVREQRDVAVGIGRAGAKVDWLNAIRTGHIGRRHDVVVKASGLVKGKDEDS